MSLLTNPKGYNKHMVDYNPNLKKKTPPAQFFSDIFENINSKCTPKPKWSKGQDWSRWDRRKNSYLLASPRTELIIWGPEEHQDPYTILAYKSADNVWGYFAAKSVSSAKRIAEFMHYEIQRYGLRDVLDLSEWYVVDGKDLEYISPKGHKFQIRFAVYRGAVNIDVPLLLQIEQNNLEIFTEVTTFHLPSLSCAIKVARLITHELEHDQPAPE